MKIRKTIVSLALACVMVLGLMPGMGMTALADVQTSYTTTNGDIVNAEPGDYGLISVTLNGTDITSQLTKQ